MFHNLPTWMTSGYAPAAAVIGFFWNGDDALSTEFKQWLSERISGAKLSAPGISSIEPLGRVFTYVYGERYLGLSVILRVYFVSIISIVACLLADQGVEGVYSTYEYGSGISKTTLLTLIVVNIFFDYLSVAKSRLLIQKVSKLSSNNRPGVLITLDFFLTLLILAVYLVIVNSVAWRMADVDFQHGVYGHFAGQTFGRNPYVEEITESAFYTIEIPFFVTISVSFILSVLYSSALLLLVSLGYVGRTVNFVRWMLPVKVFPVRSIGAFAGALVFLFIGISQAISKFISG